MRDQLVSIIIPTYNRAKYIGETLESILNQTYRNWECILVDDGSSDNTREIINEYIKLDDRIKLFFRPKSRIKGANSCRNYGYELSKGLFIQWFDADDIMSSTMLQEKIYELKLSKTDFVVSEAVEFQVNINNIIKRWKQRESETPMVEHALGKINFLISGPLFKKTFLKGKSLFNESLQRKQEWEFYTRLLGFGPQYSILRKPLFYYRNHPESINGINSPETIRSMILADLLVYKNTIETISEENKKFKFQQHFFRKIISRSKIALKNKYLFTYFKGLWGALSIIDFNYIINYFQRK